MSLEEVELFESESNEEHGDLIGASTSKTKPNKNCCPCLSRCQIGGIIAGGAFAVILVTILIAYLALRTDKIIPEADDVLAEIGAGQIGLGNLSLLLSTLQSFNPKQTIKSCNMP